jgi:hypothetical protein
VPAPHPAAGAAGSMGRKMPQMDTVILPQLDTVEHFNNLR